MAASYPKADAERRNRVQPAFGWVHLAPRPNAKAPTLPDREAGWHPETLQWWRDLWMAPQAAMWDQTGRTLWPLARLHDVAVCNGTSAALEAEMRQHEDRHGLNPKAMLQLRWRVGDPGDLDNVAAEPVRTARPAASATRRRRLLRSIDEAAS